MTLLQSDNNENSVEEYFNLANRQLAGQMTEESMQNYRRVLEIRPEHIAAKNNLGQCLYSLGRIDDAKVYFQEIIDSGQEVAEAYYNLASCLVHENNLLMAVQYYQSALRIKPAYLDAWHNLGIVFKDMGNYEQAESAFRNELIHDNTKIEGWFLLGMVCQLQSKIREAVSSYQEALKIGDHVVAAYNLGICRHAQARYDMAIAMFEQVINWQPDNVMAWNNLGRSLEENQQHDQAVTAYQKAIAIKPDFCDAIANLGNMLREEGKIEDAIAHYKRAVSFDPNHAQSLYNIGCCYQGMNNLDKAEYWYRRSIKIKPDLVEAHWNLSHVLLLRGEYEEGFSEYQWRWRRAATPKPSLSIPEWQGEERPDATLLVHTEQGFGDTIQFVRYLPWIQKRVGRIIFVCEEPLMPLFSQNNLTYDAMITKDAILDVACKCDIHAGLLALPNLFGSGGGDTLPPPVQLKASDKLIAEYEPFFQPAEKHLKVGLAWQGSKGHKNDKNRSCQLADLRPLVSCPGITFFSLQKEIDPQLNSIDIVDLSANLTDFHHTAALIHHLDLIISVDTSVAHLASSMGKEVWLMLPFVPDWRWLLDVDQSPWYPSMRLFRQEKSGDWAGVVDEMMRKLGVMRQSKA